METPLEIMLCRQLLGKLMARLTEKVYQSSRFLRQAEELAAHQLSISWGYFLGRVTGNLWPLHNNHYQMLLKEMWKPRCVTSSETGGINFKQLLRFCCYYYRPVDNYLQLNNYVRHWGSSPHLLRAATLDSSEVGQLSEMQIDYKGNRNT